MKIHVATSPLTNTIYAGELAKSADRWLHKADMTGPACAAVAEHVLAYGKPVVVTCNGKPAFEITVRDLRGQQS